MLARRMMAIVMTVALSATACRIAGRRRDVPPASASATATQKAGSDVSEATPSPVASPVVQASAGLPSAGAASRSRSPMRSRRWSRARSGRTSTTSRRFRAPSHHEAQATAFVAAVGDGTWDSRPSSTRVGNVIIRKPATAGHGRSPRRRPPGAPGHGRRSRRPTPTVDFADRPIDAPSSRTAGCGRAARPSVPTTASAWRSSWRSSQADDAVARTRSRRSSPSTRRTASPASTASRSDVLPGRSYINVDNEVEGQFLISSAGGVYVAGRRGYTRRRRRRPA